MAYGICLIFSPFCTAFEMLAYRRFGQISSTASIRYLVRVVQLSPVYFVSCVYIKLINRLVKIDFTTLAAASSINVYFPFCQDQSNNVVSH